MQNYHIERPLAQGSASSVFRVIRVFDRQCFVLKRTCLEDASARTIAAAEQEVAILQKCKHPCIVGMIDHFEVVLPPAGQLQSERVQHQHQQQCGRRGDLCLILEPMHHGDISHVLSTLHYTATVNQNPHSLTTISDHVVMAWFVQILLAVQYLHSRGICHADLKTSNIFVDQNSQYVALGDLGSAHPPAAAATSQQQSPQQKHNSSWETGAVGGSPIMFSPERMKGGPASLASDMWSLGVLLLEIATGSNPFAAARDISQLIVRVCKGEIPQLPAAQLMLGSGREMQKLVSWMLNADPAKRPTINDVLRHPFVQQHLDLFFRKLLAPPEVVPLQRSPSKRRPGNTTTTASLDDDVAASAAAAAAAAEEQQKSRWHKFVVGADKFNPHRLMLCPALEEQLRLFLPTLFSAYQRGAETHVAPKQQQPASLSLATQQQQQQQHESVKRGTSSGGGPSSLQNLLSLPSFIIQSQPPALEHLQRQQPLRPSALTPAHLLALSQQQQQQQEQEHRAVLTNADLVPHIAGSNTFSRRSPAVGGGGGAVGLPSSTHSSPLAGDRRHSHHNISVGGSLMGHDSTCDVVPPEHVAPTCLTPYQHQQIPLTKLRGARTQAPFFVEEVAVAKQAQHQWHPQPATKQHRQQSQPHQHQHLQQVSPLRAAGGGVSHIAPTPEGTKSLIAALLNKK